MPVASNSKTGKKSSTGNAGGMRANVSPATLGVAIVLVVLALGAGAFYLINGGWQTDGQKKWQFDHETAPILAAKRGRTDLLEKENSRRKAAGEPLLQAEERHETANNVKQQLEGLQSRMKGGQGAPQGGQ